MKKMSQRCRMPVEIRRLTGTVLVCERCCMAESFISRFVGLLGRSELSAGDGLWLRPSSGIHTFGMRFAIDVVALDKNVRVVALIQKMPPWRVAILPWKTRSTLELASGEIVRRGLSIGDLLYVDSPATPVR